MSAALPHDAPAGRSWTVAALSVGHLGSDFAQGTVPALLPFLTAAHGYSYAQGTALILAVSMGSSVAQPGFGLLVDRRSLPLLAPLGVLAAGVAVAALGLVSGYAAVFAIAVGLGVSVAAFHPEAARTAARSSPNRARAMSVFAVGGNAGFALAPLVVAAAVTALGLGGTTATALLPVACAATVFAVVSRRPPRREPAPRAGAAGGDRARWRPFWTLVSMATLRSGVYFGLQAFVPAYVVHEYGASSAIGDAALTIVLVAGVAGALCGGYAANRVGRKPVVVASLAALPPLFALLLVAGEREAFPLLALAGFFTVANLTVAVVMGQEFLPDRLGMASGIMLGLVISAGSGIAELLGLLADATSLRTAFAAIALLPLLALVLAVRLPETQPAPAT